MRLRAARNLLSVTMVLIGALLVFGTLAFAIFFLVIAAITTGNWLIVALIFGILLVAGGFIIAP